MRRWLLAGWFDDSLPLRRDNGRFVFLREHFPVYDDAFLDRTTSPSSASYSWHILKVRPLTMVFLLVITSLGVTHHMRQIDAIVNVRVVPRQAVFIATNRSSYEAHGRDVDLQNHNLWLRDNVELRHQRMHVRERWSREAMLSRSSHSHSHSHAQDRALRSWFPRQLSGDASNGLIKLVYLHALASAPNQRPVI